MKPPLGYRLALCTLILDDLELKLNSLDNRVENSMHWADTRSIERISC